MAMAPKENATDHTVWTSVYLDALVSDAVVAFQDYKSIIIVVTLSVLFKSTRLPINVLSLTRMTRCLCNGDKFRLKDATYKEKGIWEIITSWS